ncbi:FkbO/Hyg5 family chorismatase [Caballeronia sp. GAFFF3]|uniref:FkbO/Hyg5 family chorismatase n=1 Tax=Caballeronia sp. GAFFF3 TaxID=2921759 RepID=UPI0020298406|nr:FkbO/Hyg5 family chorismatase [Caballeronia sp. GAFFF3]
MMATPRSRFIAHDATCEDDVLARIVFGAASGGPCIESGVPTLRLAMCDDSHDGFAEIWTGNGPIRSGRFNDLVFAHDDAFLFCAGFIASSGRYTEATRQAYGDAFALVGERDFPKIFRMWNFIPHINGANREGLEVYRDFCRGRAIAFEQDYTGASGMPAATGIGTSGDGVGFYFLACRANSPRHIENSRQTPAYEYPQRYGPKSPSFARGTLLDDTLYVSGTASILGHETVHEGDLDKQWHVAIGNIAHLIGIENLEAQNVSGGYTLRDLDQIKVYYRHAADLPRVMKLAQTAFHADANIRYVKADICRADLLVEIEGIASYRRRSD